MAHQYKGLVKSIPNGPFSCMSHHFLINSLANNLMLIFVINSGGRKIELLPLRALSVSPRSYQSPSVPVCCWLSPSQIDWGLIEKPAQLSDWAVNTDWPEVGLLSCVNSFNTLRPLCWRLRESESSVRHWGISARRGSRAAHTACVMHVHMCVWERKCTLRH